MNCTTHPGGPIAGGAPAVRPDTHLKTGTYRYMDRQGRLAYEVLRYKPEAYLWRRPTPGGGYIWDLVGVERVLYRLPDLMRADRASWVFVTEREGDADRLASLGLIATTSPGGLGKWKDEFAETLRSRRVAVISDNDEAGRRLAQTVAMSCREKAAVVKVVALPGLPEEGDIGDWLENGNTAARLLDLVERTLPWTPSAVGVRVKETLSPISGPGRHAKRKRKAAKLDSGFLWPDRGTPSAPSSEGAGDHQNPESDALASDRHPASLFGPPTVAPKGG